MPCAPSEWTTTCRPFTLPPTRPIRRQQHRPPPPPSPTPPQPPRPCCRWHCVVRRRPGLRVRAHALHRVECGARGESPTLPRAAPPWHALPPPLLICCIFPPIPSPDPQHSHKHPTHTLNPVRLPARAPLVAGLLGRDNAGAVCAAAGAAHRARVPGVCAGGGGSHSCAVMRKRAVGGRRPCFWRHASDAWAHPASCGFPRATPALQLRLSMARARSLQPPSPMSGWIAGGGRGATPHHHHLALSCPCPVSSYAACSL